MKKFLILLFFVLNGFCHAQTIPTPVRADWTIDRLMDRNGLSGSDQLYGVGISPGELIGDTYLNNRWNRASFLLYKDEKLIEGVWTRYDIKGDLFEIQTNMGLKIVDGKNIKSFVWLDSITNGASFFINTRDLKTGKGKIYSFMEVISDGKLPLLKRTYINIKKADYRPEFDTGSKDDIILKVDEFYVLRDDQLIDLPRKKKEIFSLFGDRSVELENFYKVNGLRVNEERSLILLFNEYNLLVK
ncbi:MAG: hypothetical protein HC811_02305 [Flammeovirgaceae bacterium]|nr:hypothetical protein [Flammeovirgaceae bacterium]